MTSQKTSPAASPSIVWDKQRLVAHKSPQTNGKVAYTNGKAPNTNGKGPVSGAKVVAAVSGPGTRRANHVATSTALLGRPVHRSPESELKMSFDPMKDLHMWTMWRVAVNGRIVDETRRRSHAQTANGRNFDLNPFGQALVKTPLDRFIRVENGSQSIAGVMMDPHGEGGGHLATQQFVYYGIPRVVLKKPKCTVHLPEYTFSSVPAGFGR